MFDRERVVYRASEYIYNFRNFWTIKTFGRYIYEREITLEEANIDQDNLLGALEILIIKQNLNLIKKLFLKTCINFLKEES